MMKTDKVIVLVYLAVGVVSGAISNSYNGVMSFFIPAVLYVSSVIILSRLAREKTSKLIPNSLITFLLVWIVVWILLYNL